jgi:hypothetical protein
MANEAKIDRFGLMFAGVRSGSNERVERVCSLRSGENGVRSESNYRLLIKMRDLGKVGGRGS